MTYNNMQRALFYKIFIYERERTQRYFKKYLVIDYLPRKITLKLIECQFLISHAPAVWPSAQEAILLEVLTEASVKGEVR